MQIIIKYDAYQNGTSLFPCNYGVALMASVFGVFEILDTAGNAAVEPWEEKAEAKQKE